MNGTRGYIAFILLLFLTINFYDLEGQQISSKMKFDQMEWKDYVLGVLTNTETEEYLYNTDGRVTTATLKLWNSSANSYQNKNKIETTYNNNLVDCKKYFWFNTTTSSWIDTLKREYEYNNGLLQKLTVFNRSSVQEEWKPASVEQYTYDNNQNKTDMLFMAWDDETSSWANYEKIKYTYDSQGELSTTTSWVWDFLFDEWLLYDKEEYSSENGWDKYIYYEWNEMKDKWTYVFRDSLFYSAELLKMKYYSLYWDTRSNQWIDFTMEYYELTSDNRISLYEEYEWNETTLKYDYYDKEKYEYDSYGNVTLFIDYNKTNQYNQWVESLKEIYQYDHSYQLDQLIIPYDEPQINGVYFNSMMTSIDAYEWNTTKSDWQEASIGLFSYSPIIITDVDAKESGEITFYPNPFNEYFFIDGIDNGNISIISLDGKKILGSVINSNPYQINTSLIPPGVYIVKVEFTTDKCDYLKVIKE